MDTFATHAWLAVAVPLLLAAVIGAFGRWLGRASAWMAMVAPAAALAVGAASARFGGGVAVLASPGSRSVYAGAVTAARSFAWLALGTTKVTAGYAVDGLCALMLIVVGVVALMVMLFSVGYMAGDKGYARYFAVLCLFTAAMSALVMADTLLGIVVAWELVGACSYLLIGFWYERPSAANAALKAFLVTHVGDAGMLLGIAVLWRATGTVSLAQIGGRVASLQPATVTAAALLLLLAAIGKSAQFPLHFWLPDAMEGPTPVSALIHAATMVAAGVFLLARFRVLFTASPTALTVVLVVGAFTALASATVAVTQRDIKKVLAYSTISQLGFMFAALGAGAWTAAIFHLVTHAAFKALLFLGAGSVIHGAGTQELPQMGGLAKKMPLTATTWIIGALALAGIPPLAGFFSKDAVLSAVLHASPIAFGALLLASLITAFYIARATWLAFFGEYRGDGHPHEGGLAMAIPLMVLAVAAALLGFASDRVAWLLGTTAEVMDLRVAGATFALALIGGLGAVWLYRRGPAADEVLEARFGGAWRAARSAYGWDGFVMRGVVAPTVAMANAAYKWVDRLAVDWVAEGIGAGAVRAGRWLSGLQNGDGQWYVALIGAGVIVLMAASVWLGR